MNATTQLQNMITNLEGLKDDAERHDKGQKAAGTRIRGAMQTVRTDAKTFRTLVLTDQKKNG